MSNPPANNAQWLLADRALTPIVSSAPLPSTSERRPLRQGKDQLQSLTSLTTTAITAYDSAARLGLGLPQRIIVETRSSGPVILHSYINPPSQRRSTQAQPQASEENGILEQARDDLRPLTATTEGGSQVDPQETTPRVNGSTSEQVSELGDPEAQDEENGLQQSPLLIASVLAPSLGEAKRAAGALERTGREVQRALIMEQQEGDSSQATIGGSNGG